MTTGEAKKKIDEMSYESLLSHWRFAAMGDPMFLGEVGEYYAEKMKEKREAVGPEGAVAASKSVGWDAR